MTEMSSLTLRKHERNLAIGVVDGEVDEDLGQLQLVSWPPQLQHVSCGQAPRSVDEVPRLQHVSHQGHLGVGGDVDGVEGGDVVVVVSGSVVVEVEDGQVLLSSLDISSRMSSKTTVYSGLAICGLCHHKF